MCKAINGITWTEVETIYKSLMKQGYFERGKVLFVSTHQSSQLNTNSPWRQDYNQRQYCKGWPELFPTPAPVLEKAAPYSWDRATKPWPAGRSLFRRDPEFYPSQKPRKRSASLNQTAGLLLLNYQTATGNPAQDGPRENPARFQTSGEASGCSLEAGHGAAATRYLRDSQEKNQNKNPQTPRFARYFYRSAAFTDSFSPRQARRRREPAPLRRNGVGGGRRERRLTRPRLPRAREGLIHAPSPARRAAANQRRRPAREEGRRRPPLPYSGSRRCRPRHVPRERWPPAAARRATWPSPSHPRAAALAAPPPDSMVGGP